MALFGDIARVLGQGTLSGLGTAEQQRGHAERAADLALRQQQMQELVKSRLAATGEKKREFDLANQDMDITSLVRSFNPEYVGPPIIVKRQFAAPMIAGHAAQQRRPETLPLGDVLEASGIRPAPTITPPSAYVGQGAGQSPAESVPVPSEGLSIRGRWPGRFAETRVPATEATKLIHEETKRQAVERQNAVNSTAQTLYDQYVEAGMDQNAARASAMTEAQAQYPGVSVNKAPTFRQPTLLATEQGYKTTRQIQEAEKAGTPLVPASVAEARARRAEAERNRGTRREIEQEQLAALRRRRELAEEAGDLRSKMAKGTLGADDATKQAQRIGGFIDREMKAADAYTKGSQEHVDALASAAEARVLARELNAYAGGKPSGAKKLRAATRAEATEAKKQAGGDVNRFKELLKNKGIDPSLEMVQ